MRWALPPLIAALAAWSCAHVPLEESDGLDFETRRARLEAVERWEMRGRLAVDTGEQAFQGRFQWRQDAGALLLSIRGPFGNSVVEISGSPDALTVRARGETWRMADAEVELSEVLGWWLPVTSLDAWLLGLPDAEFEARTRFAAAGVLATLDQRLWHVDYDGYRLADDVLVPGRIEMRHETLRLRLTVDDWAPTAAAPPS
jgi:outer membrane lipoprotein LolB